MTTQFEKNEEDVSALNKIMAERKNTLERNISVQSEADKVKAAIEKKFKEATVVITGEEDEIRERLERIAIMSAHMRAVGAEVGIVFPSKFVEQQNSQVQAGKETLAAQQVIENKRVNQAAIKTARAAKKKNTEATTKPASRLVSKAKSVVEDVDLD